MNEFLRGVWDSVGPLLVLVVVIAIVVTLGKVVEKITGVD